MTYTPPTIAQLRTLLADTVLVLSGKLTADATLRQQCEHLLAQALLDPSLAQQYIALVAQLTSPPDTSAIGDLNEAALDELFERGMGHLTDAQFFALAADELMLNLVATRIENAIPLDWFNTYLPADDGDVDSRHMNDVVSDILGPKSPGPRAESDLHATMRSDRSDDQASPPSAPGAANPHADAEGALKLTAEGFAKLLKNETGTLTRTGGRPASAEMLVRVKRYGNRRMLRVSFIAEGISRWETLNATLTRGGETLATGRRDGTLAVVFELPAAGPPLPRTAVLRLSLRGIATDGPEPHDEIRLDGPLPLQLLLPSD